MEYGKCLSSESRDQDSLTQTAINNLYKYQNNNFMKYVGFEAASSTKCEELLFKPETVKAISQKLTYLLRGVDPDGKKIVVTDDVIYNALSGVYSSFRPVVGDIYSRYQIMNDEINRNDVQDMINRTIQLIYDSIRNEIMMEENNKKLTIWTTVYGDFNKHGLRQTPPIKVRKRRPDPMLFNMNY